MADAIYEVLERLARNVEAAVHAMYRGDVRQQTAKVRTGQLVREAAEAMRGHLGAPAPAARSLSCEPPVRPVGGRGCGRMEP